MWPGSIVDKVMEKKVIPLVIDKKPIDFNLIADEAVELAKKQFIFSENKRYNDQEERSQLLIQPPMNQLIAFLPILIIVTVILVYVIVYNVKNYRRK